MSRDLSVYSDVKDPLAFVNEMGNSIAKSQFFNCANADQGKVLAMECLAKRLPPLSLAERYHIIQGKLSMKSEAMLAGFRQHGGKHKVVSRTPDLASIELTFEGQSLLFSLSWEEAKQESFPWGKTEKGQPKLKDNWATPRGRMQMLWARVVSDGVRCLCPEVNSGTYTPEEVSDFDGNVSSEVETTATETGNGNAEDAQVIDAEFEPVTESAQTPTPTPETVTTASRNGNGDDHPTGPGGYATIEQTSRISELLAQRGPKALVVKEQLLNAAGVTDLVHFKFEFAAAVIPKLEAAVAKQQAEQQQGQQATTDTITPTPETVPTGESQQSPDANTADVNGPCSQDQIDQIKSLIDEITPFDAGIAQKILTAIKPCTSIAQLTWAAAQKITKSLDDKLRKHAIDKTLEGGENGTNGNVEANVAEHAEEATAAGK